MHFCIRQQVLLGGWVPGPRAILSHASSGQRWSNHHKDYAQKSPREQSEPALVCFQRERKQSLRFARFDHAVSGRALGLKQFATFICSNVIIIPHSGQSSAEQFPPLSSHSLRWRIHCQSSGARRDSVCPTRKIMVGGVAIPFARAGPACTAMASGH